LRAVTINFPTICLIVSGGHSDLVLMKNHGEYELLGRTRDNAAGEAFDKVARILGLGPPLRSCRLSLAAFYTRLTFPACQNCKTRSAQS
jgi:tRNA A37 threonylcarbamoyltransferase TsaD